MQTDSPAAAEGVRCTMQGQPCIRLHNSRGDTALVALHGAQVLSWNVDGRARLYLSSQAVLDGQAAIRGGVPVVFPQFNQRGALPKHGFARNLPWQLTPGALALGDTSSLSLDLGDSNATRVWWPERFSARLTVTLAPRSLRIALTVRNSNTFDDGVPPAGWAFTSALHTYLWVDDVDRAQLYGLEGCARWNAVTDQRSTQAGPVGFAGEYDSVFCAPVGPLLLRDGDHCLRIAQSRSFGDTVVWNPGEALCTRLSDMPGQGYRNMLCVEAAQIDEPVMLEPHAEWRGWQELTVLPAA